MTKNNPPQISWRYVLTELFLIVAGILLAINLNTWNANRKLEEQVQLSLDKIRGELQNNMSELKDVLEANENCNAFYSAIANLTGQEIDKITCAVSQMDSLRKNYGDNFDVVDSTKVGTATFEYEVQLMFSLEYGEMMDIAWRTAQISNNINEYDYECLEQIISTYGLQDLFVEVQRKFLDFEIVRDQEVYVATYQLSFQFAQDLMERYEDLELALENCH